MENDLKGNENYFDLTGGSSYRGFELPGVDCSSRKYPYPHGGHGYSTVPSVVSAFLSNGRGH